MFFLLHYICVGVPGAVLHLTEGDLGAVLHIAEGQDMTERGRGRMVRETEPTTVPELGEIGRGRGGRNESGRKPGERKPGGGRRTGGRTAGGRMAGGRTVGGRMAGRRRAGGRMVGGRMVGGRRAGVRRAGGRRAGGRIAGGVEGTYTVELGMNDGFRAYGVSFATCMSQTAAGCVPYSHDLMVLSGMLSTCVVTRGAKSHFV